MRVTRRGLLRTAGGLALLGAAGSLASLVEAQSDDDDDSANGFGPAVWMRVPRIEIDSHISDVGVTGGYYDVPWFDVGHHVDSPSPGELGNSIYNGHVATINAGEVFRRLHELQPTDAVYLYTTDYRLDWVVTDVFSVSQDDNSFLDATEMPRITLYTCTGQFNPIERNYAERLVAIAQLVNTGPRDLTTS
jgi:LPXTG-site transpeptidase (sortase) family protein